MAYSYDLQSSKSATGKRQIHWRENLAFLRQFLEMYSAALFRRSANRTTCAFRGFLRVRPAPFSSYHQGFGPGFQEKDASDLHSPDCRTCDKRTNHFELDHRPIHTIRGESIEWLRLYRQYLSVRIPACNLPSIASKHRGRRICQLYSRIAVRLLGYNGFAFQTSNLICQSLAGCNPRREFSFPQL